MEKYKIEANEQFFLQVLRFVKEGGVYGWPAEAEVFTKKNGKLVGSPASINKVRGIVSEEFFTKTFEEQ